MKLAPSWLALFLLAPGLRADFDAARWQYRRPVMPASTSGMARLNPDETLYKGSAARLSDVRILRDQTETPYVLRTLQGRNDYRDVQASMINKSVEPKVGVRFTLDAGANARHDRVRIDTQKHNFKQRVEVETSDDDRQWSIARDDAYIFDFSQGGNDVRILAVDFPVSTKRYLRVTVFGWSDIAAIDSAWLSYYDEQQASRDSVVRFQHPAAKQDAATQSTDVTLDIGYGGLPHDRLLLEIAPGLFNRAVSLEGSLDGQTWMPVGQGAIWRTSKAESLAVEFPEQWDRYLRVHIWNRDDQPVVVQSLTLQALVREIRFPLAGAGPYWLYYGNDGARQPSYDLASVLPEKSSSPDAIVKLGPQETNPAYRAPEKPFSDRNPMLLYTVLALAILGMGFVTFRFLKNVQSADATSSTAKPATAPEPASPRSDQPSSS